GGREGRDGSSPRERVHEPRRGRHDADGGAGRYEARPGEGLVAARLRRRAPANRYGGGAAIAHGTPCAGNGRDRCGHWKDDPGQEGGAMKSPAWMAAIGLTVPGATPRATAAR